MVFNNPIWFHRIKQEYDLVGPARFRVCLAVFGIKGPNIVVNNNPLGYFSPSSFRPQDYSPVFLPSLLDLYSFQTLLPIELPQEVTDKLKQIIKVERERLRSAEKSEPALSETPLINGGVRQKTLPWSDSVESLVFELRWEGKNE